MPERFSGTVDFLDSAGNSILTVDPDSSSTQIVYKTPSRYQVMGLTSTGLLTLMGAGADYGARIDGTLGWLILGGGGDRRGKILIRDERKEIVIALDAFNAKIQVGKSGNAGDIVVRDGHERDVIVLDARNATVNVGTSGNAGEIVVRDALGRDVIVLDARNATVNVGTSGNAGDVIVLDEAGRNAIHLNGASGDIILNNADCAEDFDLTPAVVAEPGTVMVLDQDGAIQPSSVAYDKTVAGVISGAGECKPGIVLDRRPSETPRSPLALVGKVYCKVDATSTPVEVGDLLTTSSTPGHAMKATDPQRAFGAVIGKALRPLQDGTGLIPILVALQ